MAVDMLMSRRIVLTSMLVLSGVFMIVGIFVRNYSFPAADIFAPGTSLPSWMKDDNKRAYVTLMKFGVDGKNGRTIDLDAPWTDVFTKPTKNQSKANTGDEDVDNIVNKAGDKANKFMGKVGEKMDNLTKKATDKAGKNKKYDRRQEIASAILLVLGGAIAIFIGFLLVFPELMMNFIVGPIVSLLCLFTALGLQVSNLRGRLSAMGINNARIDVGIILEILAIIMLVVTVGLMAFWRYRTTTTSKYVA